MRGGSFLTTAGFGGLLIGCIWASIPSAAPPVSASPDPLEATPADGSSDVEASVTYGGCNEVRALGKAPLYAGQPGYREDMDGDGDGIACETHRT